MAHGLPVAVLVAAADDRVYLHGGAWQDGKDAQRPINQLHELEGAYARAGLEAQTFVLHGVGHDGAPFFRGRPAEAVLAFLKETLGR